MPKEEKKNKEIKLNGPAWQKMAASKPTGTIRGKSKAKVA